MIRDIFMHSKSWYSRKTSSTLDGAYRYTTPGYHDITTISPSGTVDKILLISFKSVNNFSNIKIVKLFISKYFGELRESSTVTALTETVSWGAGSIGGRDRPSVITLPFQVQLPDKCFRDPTIN
ncbi:hypothetical protein FQR65_LT01386 [Abscondita terminalis]|nr:hypothetical protein FQR65_LT01386 [Abscondita terminalis]